MGAENGLVFELRAFAGHKFEDGTLKLKTQWMANEFGWVVVDDLGNVGEALADYHSAYLDVCYAMLENTAALPCANVESTVERITGARFETGRLQYLVKQDGSVETWTDIDELSSDDVINALHRFHDTYFEVLDAFIDAHGHGPADDDVAIIDYE
ncbi:hypothetical protein AAVH_18162 [Aphelenchoides avenae]|nr:hypothetical protein AAVH_38373 [Aphelenchus avenae]KAH7714505.1 hypothetical protein AAVH_18162 [Aphelenchus avenae]